MQAESQGSRLRLKLGSEGKSINMSPGEDHLRNRKEPLEQVADAGAGRTKGR